MRIWSSIGGRMDASKSARKLRGQSHQNGGGQSDIMRSAHRPLFHSLGMRSPFDRDSAAAAAAHADIRSESKKLLGQ